MQSILKPGQTINSSLGHEYIIKNFIGFLKKPDFYVWKKPLGKNDSPEQIGSVEIIKRVSSKTKIKPEAKDNLQDIEWKIEVDKEE